MKKILIILTTILFIGCTEETPPTMYTLTVSSNPTEGGIINPSSGEYEEGTEVTLRVNPNTNYEFDMWSGSSSGSESPLTITMDGDKNIVGNFKLMNPLYLDSNGVTIKSYDWGEVGDTGEIDGVTYTIVDREKLKTMIMNVEDVSQVCTSKITNMSYMFRNSEFNGDISNWDVSNVINMDQMFANSKFNGDISNWDVSNVIKMQSLFLQNFVFNGDISNWDVSSVTDMGQMFFYTQFNRDISNWDVSNVISMENMFYQSVFNKDISSWNVSNVNNMSRMFYNSKNSNFNFDLSSWNVERVTNCTMFSYNVKYWTLPKPNFTNCDPN
jgi:surface protein